MDVISLGGRPTRNKSQWRGLEAFLIRLRMFLFHLILQLMVTPSSLCDSTRSTGDSSMVRVITPVSRE